MPFLVFMNSPDVPPNFVENAPGRYAVNTECIDCDLCRQEAPANFVRETQKGFSYVARQPRNEREEQQCRSAKATCPVNAISDDNS
jgi:ferredoxin